MAWCFGVILVYDVVYVLMMLVYVHMYIDVNSTMSYVIKLHYAICCYDVMLLCWFFFQQGDNGKYNIELRL